MDKITCNADGFCQYRFQEGSLFGCKFDKICQYQAPLLTSSHEATEEEVMLVIKNFDLTCEIETKYHYRQKLTEELLTHFHITKRGEG